MRILRTSNKKGFLLYIVIAVLLVLAIMAFALSSFKSGTVTQLAKNIDQNRLTLVAQSANAEVLASIRSQVNQFDPPGQIYERFRDIFPDKSGNMPALNKPVVIYNGFKPPKTGDMTKSAGYEIEVKSRAVLTAFREAPATSVTAFNGYLDVYSQAYRKGFERNLIEVHERHDVRLVDIRHRLDKYALFVKNYCPDYNNPHRRVIVEGLDYGEPYISQIYIGNHNYPDCAAPEKYLWFDLFYDETRKLSGFKTITGCSDPRESFGGASPNNLFTRKDYLFQNVEGIQAEQFYNVKTVIDLYEKFVNQAADGTPGAPSTPYKTKADLQDKCKKAMDASNSNAASWVILEDFYTNFKPGGNGDYSKCDGFLKILNTCIMSWDYQHGYTDAASIWNIEDAQRPLLPSPRPWATALAFGGLASTTVQYRKKGPFFSEFLDEKNGKIYNPERLKVGKMAMLFGEKSDKKVLIEGPAFLRYFKVAYLEFKDEKPVTLELYNKPVDLLPEPIPMNFYRYDKGETFLNTVLSKPLPTGGILKEKYLMSRDIATFPINMLQGDSIKYFNGDGDEATLEPFNQPTFYFDKPLQPSGMNIPAGKFGRLIDFRTVSWNYANTKQFKDDRVGEIDGEKILFVDGVMYIEEGDLDLSDVGYFYGKGLIYLGKGNCFIGDFKKLDGKYLDGNKYERNFDTVRFYLRGGDFVIESSKDEVEIHASLTAFYYPFGGENQHEQGSLILSNKKHVTIVGNLLVDYLYTYDKDDKGLKNNGTLVIKHDPFIYEPALKAGSVDHDPFHISISPVKTIFSVNSGSKTF
jgi:hypothetical protein